MLISDSKEFIFVHVSKAAGSSITHLLEPYSLAKNPSPLASVLRPLGLPRDYRRFRFLTHGPLSAARRVMPADRFGRYFKFAFVRNPWDRLVSEYNAMLRKPHHRRYPRVARLGSFAAYVRHEAPRIVASQAALLAGPEGRVGVDFVGRFETLNADARHVCDRLDIPCDLPHANAHPHADYRTFYDPATVDFVRARWARDVETFGYDFEGEPR